MASALATLDVDSALAEIANGTIARTIAQRYNVTADGLRKALHRAKPEEYKQAVQSQVEHWVFESADEMNELAADQVCIARARARADFRLKLAGALHPDFALKQQLQIDQRVTVEVVLDQDAAALLGSLRHVSYPQTIEGELPKKEAELAIDLDNQEHSV